MKTRSIRRELVVWLSAGLLVAIAVAAVATYLRAREEANEIFDYQLKQMSASLTGVPARRRRRRAPSPGSDALIVQVWDRDGVQVYLSQPQQPLPRDAQPGFNTVRTDAGEWRVFSALAGNQIVQVAQPMSVRRELAASMALRTIVPLLAIVPFLVLLVWFGIARGLSPLERVAVALAERSPGALRPLAETGLPSEVAPLVHALNGLLDRLDQRARRAARVHRRCGARAAHAAHRRAPAGAARRARDDGRRARRGACRAARRARARDTPRRAAADARTRGTRRERAAVRAGERDGGRARGARRIRADRRGAPRRSRHGRSNAAAAGDAFVSGDANALRTLVSNLVDNAVRHTPAGGRVDVAAQRDGADVLLTVRDSGPGIPASERERVFDRFYRVPGEAAAGMTGQRARPRDRQAHRRAPRRNRRARAGSAGPGGEGLGVTVRLPGSGRRPAGLSGKPCPRAAGGAPVGSAAAGHRALSPA